MIDNAELIISRKTFEDHCEHLIQRAMRITDQVCNHKNSKKILYNFYICFFYSWLLALNSNHPTLMKCFWSEAQVAFQLSKNWCSVNLVRKWTGAWRWTRLSVMVPAFWRHRNAGLFALVFILYIDAKFHSSTHFRRNYLASRWLKLPPCQLGSRIVTATSFRLFPKIQTFHATFVNHSELLRIARRACHLMYGLKKD